VAHPVPSISAALIFEHRRNLNVNLKHLSPSGEKHNAFYTQLQEK